MEDQRGVLAIEGDDSLRAQQGDLSAQDKAVLAAAAMPRDRGLKKLLPLLQGGNFKTGAVQAQTGVSALHKACIKANAACISALCSAGWDLLLRDGMQRTPLHLLTTHQVGPLRCSMRGMPPLQLTQAFLVRDSTGALPLGVSLAKLLSLANSVDPTNLASKTPGVHAMAAGMLHAFGCMPAAQCPSLSCVVSKDDWPAGYSPAYITSDAAQVFAPPPDGVSPPPLPFSTLIYLSRIAGPTELLCCLLWCENAGNYRPSVLLTPPAATSSSSPPLTASTQTSASSEPAAEAAGAASDSDSFQEDEEGGALAVEGGSASPQRTEMSVARQVGVPVSGGWTAHGVWWGPLRESRGPSSFLIQDAVLAGGVIQAVRGAQGEGAAPAADKLLDVLSSQDIMWTLRKQLLLSRQQRRGGV